MDDSKRQPGSSEGTTAAEEPTMLAPATSGAVVVDGAGREADRHDSPPAPVRRAEPTQLTVGDRVSRYVLKSVLGRGGMGTVFLADDPELGRRVAIKIVRSEADANQLDTSAPQEAQRRLLREAQAMAQVSHANLVTIYDVGVYRDQVFIAMEYIRGRTLTKWLKLRHTWSEVLEVFLAAARGLHAAHSAGLVHRDFKPDNVLIAADGGVQILDFGLARASAGEREISEIRPAQGTGNGTGKGTGKGTAGGTAAPPAGMERPRLNSDLTRTGWIMGTPAYMAPEQHSGLKTDARSDQFAFCVALYEGLYGERPFRGKNFEELFPQVMRGEIQPAPSGTVVPRRVRRVLLRGLSVRPDERYADMAEVSRALERAASARLFGPTAAYGALAGVLVIGTGLWAVAQADRLPEVVEADGATEGLGVDEGIDDGAAEGSTRTREGRGTRLPAPPKDGDRGLELPDIDRLVAEEPASDTEAAGTEGEPELAATGAGIGADTEGSLERPQSPDPVKPAAEAAAGGDTAPSGGVEPSGTEAEKSGGSPTKEKEGDLVPSVRQGAPSGAPEAARPEPNPSPKVEPATPADESAG